MGEGGERKQKRRTWMSGVFANSSLPTIILLEGAIIPILGEHVRKINARQQTVTLAHNLKSKVMTKLHYQLSPIGNLLRGALSEQEADAKLLNGILVERERKLDNLLSAEKGRLSPTKNHLTTTVALLLTKAAIHKPLT